jgi:hypothetical protein
LEGWKVERLEGLGPFGLFFFGGFEERFEDFKIPRFED